VVRGESDGQGRGEVVVGGESGQERGGGMCGGMAVLLAAALTGTVSWKTLRLSIVPAHEFVTTPLARRGWRIAATSSYLAAQSTFIPPVTFPSYSTAPVN